MSIYNSMAIDGRKSDHAGARRPPSDGLLNRAGGISLLCVGGGLLGILLGHGLVIVGSPLIAARSGLVINPAFFDPLEFIIVPVMVVMATLVGFLPALTAYRTDVADALSN